MRVAIEDRDALQRITPAALSAYAESNGWLSGERYREHSTVYTAEGLPELILPNTSALGDYALVVGRAIETLAEVTDLDQLEVYRNLMTADRDVIRIRALNDDAGGTVALDSGVELLRGSYDMILAAACSLREPQAVYRAGANREATELLSQVRLGHTERGSFVVNILTPQIARRLQPALLPDHEPDDDPIERRLTRRFAEALAAARRAAEATNSGDDRGFASAVSAGVSANLCDALARVIGPFSEVATHISWARTRPVERREHTMRFMAPDAAVLREAARVFRAREPREGAVVFGFVARLHREEQDERGAIVLRSSIDGHSRAVAATLTAADYERAIHAHKDQAPVVVVGDLEQIGQRWRLHRPRITDVISREPDEELNES